MLHDPTTWTCTNIKYDWKEIESSHAYKFFVLILKTMETNYKTLLLLFFMYCKEDERHLWPHLCASLILKKYNITMRYYQTKRINFWRSSYPWKKVNSSTHTILSMFDDLFPDSFTLACKTPPLWVRATTWRKSHEASSPRVPPCTGTPVYQLLTYQERSSL